MSTERSWQVTLTVTELPHFRRLVAFVEDIERFARDVGDEEIVDMVGVLRADLARLAHDWRPEEENDG